MESRRPIYLPGMAAFVAYLGAGLPFFIVWLIISKTQLLIAIPLVVLYLALVAWILTIRASYKEPVVMKHDANITDAKDNTSSFMILHLMGATAFSFFIWLFYPLLLNSAYSNGFIYVFSIPIMASWTWFFTVLLSWLYLFTLPIYTSRVYRSKYFNLLIIALGVYFVFVIFGYSASYGHVDESGISYRSIQTKFLNKNIAWTEINTPTCLEIIYCPKNRKWTYFYNLYIQPNNKAESILKIEFEDNNKDRNSLLVILNILRQSNVPVKVQLRDTTQKKVGKDDKLDSFLKEVQNTQK